MTFKNLVTFAKQVILVPLCLLNGYGYGQNKLMSSRTGSYYTYIYKISDDALLKLYQHPDVYPDDKILQHPVDSVKNDTVYPVAKLPAGNYLKVYAFENQLKYSLIEQHSVFIRLLNTGKHTDFIITDKNGDAIHDALVNFNGHEIGFNNQDGLYSIKLSKKNILQVNHSGVSNFYLLQNPKLQPVFMSGAWFKSKWTAIKEKLGKKEAERNYNNNWQLDNNYTGFIIFNKPKYKPHDTVKFKAYIFNLKNKKPLKLPQLLVKISSQYSNASDDDKLIGKVTSYRTGAYEYSFVLTDSLDIDLDDTYRINLEDPQKMVKQDKDDDAKDARNKTYISGTFQYEEYELKSINFAMRTDKDEHSKGDTLNVFFKATDENGLPVPDGRVDLLVHSNFINQYPGSNIFVPDTLWQHTVQLDPVGETKLSLPASIFPNADFQYEIYADFYNSANESRREMRWLKYHNSAQIIKSELDGDTLKVTGYINGKNAPFKAVIYGIKSSGDTAYRQQIMLPYTIKINPGIRNYDIRSDSAFNSFQVYTHDCGISLKGNRSADSINFSINNPLGLHFWYLIYSGKTLIERGKGTSLSYKKANFTKENITCVVNTLWGDAVKRVSQVFPLTDKKLDIIVYQPLSVYPGQRVTTEVTVKDIKGKPVPNADITAWAVTSKFENYAAPFVPYLGQLHILPSIRGYSRIVQQKREWDGNLNWARWSREMGLDSIEYYKFTHTDTIYRTEAALNKDDTTTQIAPFLVRNGDIIPAEILYIDERPVYFSQAEQLQRYSFAVLPGRHNIRMRTVNQDVSFGELYAVGGKKLIIGINDTSTNAAIKIHNMPDTLTNYEAGLLNKYIIRVENTFSQRLAVINQENRLFLLNPEVKKDYHYYNSYNNTSGILTGPLADNYAAFVEKGMPQVNFVTEPGYVYTFLSGILKQKSLPQKYPFNTRLGWAATEQNFTDYALNYTSVDSVWQNYLDLRSRTTSLFYNDRAKGNVTGMLVVKPDPQDDEKYFVKNVIVYRNDDPDFIRIYAGNETGLGDFEPGRYRVLFLLKKDNYAIAENIIVKPYGKNYYPVKLYPKPKDSVSIKIDQIISMRSGMYDRNDGDIKNDALYLKEAFNEKYLDSSNFTSIIYGVITAKDDGTPIPGVTIKVKGSANGVATNSAGKFRLSVPRKGKIIISAIGFMPQELEISPGESYQIKLLTSSNQLGEVVVTGALGMKRMDLTGSISTMLAGKVAGLQVNLGISSIDPTTRIVLQGNRSTAEGEEPLVVIDGIPVTAGEMQKLKPDDIENISILKGGTAAAVYGSRAANGVIIIVTKKSMASNAANNPMPGDGNIRKNFSDYAYWQPRLTTDGDGKASFTTVFPDDITSWRTFVAAANDDRQTGFSESLIKSFKPLSAAFISPLFAVEGDRLSAIGKVMNYTSVPEKLTRTFTYNGLILKQDSLNVSNSKIDTLNVTAGGTDSLTFEYTIKKTDGYFDGEQRKIPVIKQGVEETKGIFSVLKGDTTTQMHFDGTLGKVTLHAEASVLPTLIEETDRLRDYKYLCNEQLASKLKGLLVEKRIKAYLGEPFNHEKNIIDVIKTIKENSGSQGLWGWWKGTDNELWISLHVVSALLEAENEKYAVNINKQDIINYLVYQLESYKGADKITCLQLLYTMGAKVDYKKYIAEINKEYLAEEHPSIYDHFRILLLEQQAGITVSTDELLKTMHKTVFGNVYWGEDSYHFFDNSVQISLLAYRIFKNEGKHTDVLEKIRGYLLEQRHDGGWRNTYESSLILETILLDVLVGNKQVKAPQLQLSGSISATVDKFPYTTTFTGTDISVNKTGTLPVYITGYQQYWNSEPEKISKDFTVDTWFEKNGGKMTKLKAGQAVELKAQVTAHADGDFVMIEIPISAGCSYENKNQSWENNEVHREYFKEKVSIFCRKLKQGTYTFTIKLMPRYNGEYTLNPAKAELMYFPVFYGREGMKRLVIGD